MSAGKKRPDGLHIIPYKESKENSITAEKKSLPNKEAERKETKSLAQLLEEECDVIVTHYKWTAEGKKVWNEKQKRWVLPRKPFTFFA